MNEEINLHPDKNLLLDKLEFVMQQVPQVDIQPSHVFLPGQYIREIIIPAGTRAVSKIHLTAHPVFVCGILDVYNSLTDELVEVRGYWKGITEPGTRRAFKVHQDAIITTVHAVPFVTGEENSWADADKEAFVAEIEKFLIAEHDIDLNILEACHS